MRRHREAALALTTAAALLAPLTFASTAGAGEEKGASYDVSKLSFTVRAGGRSCTVDADLYRPKSVTARRPAPAVMTTNGFGGSKTDGATGGMAKAFAERGYVALAYSGLGFAGSGCPISLDDPEVDGKVASRLISFLGGSVKADDGTRVRYVTSDGPGDPRVGMAGGSYGGAIQLATASRDRRVDALVPFITWNDLSYSLAPNGAEQGGPRGAAPAPAVPGVFKHQWANGFFMMGEAQGLLNLNLDPSRSGSGGCQHFTARACRALNLLNSERWPQDRARRTVEYLRSVSPVSYLDKVKAPTLLIQGQADTLFTLNEAADTYQTLRSHGTEAKMIWQSWGHSGGLRYPAKGELSVAHGNVGTSYVGRRILAWFDHHLRGHENTATGPDFAYYRDWAGRGGPRYASSSRFPVGAPQRLHLSGDGRLVGDAAKVRPGTRGYRNQDRPTSHSESSVVRAVGLPEEDPHDGKGSYLAWTSSPLGGPVDVVGMPRARLRVHSPKAQKAQGSGDVADRLVLFAKIYDVAPDGSQKLTQRLVAPVRVPDVTKPFTVRMPGMVHRYGKGHRLRFVIAASDGAYGGNRGIKPVTVTSSPGHTGFLEMPVTGGRLG
ncbi:CocE/NonD family hydrolase [Streptomyces sp. ODS28]|uniref:CocE/NonD family hydrolase n=1 Tax=Streptomyces sp. ODS28 TaxID=3136688 RepID=UPI0031ED0F58